MFRQTIVVYRDIVQEHKCAKTQSSWLWKGWLTWLLLSFKWLKAKCWRTSVPVYTPRHWEDLTCSRQSLHLDTQRQVALTWNNGKKELKTTLLTQNKGIHISCNITNFWPLSIVWYSQVRTTFRLLHYAHVNVSLVFQRSAGQILWYPFFSMDQLVQWLHN